MFNWNKWHMAEKKKSIEGYIKAGHLLRDKSSKKKKMYNACLQNFGFICCVGCMFVLSFSMLFIHVTHSQILKTDQPRMFPLILSLWNTFLMIVFTRILKAELPMEVSRTSLYLNRRTRKTNPEAWFMWRQRGLVTLQHEHQSASMFVISSQCWQGPKAMVIPVRAVASGSCCG